MTDRFELPNWQQPTGLRAWIARKLLKLDFGAPPPETAGIVSTVTGVSDVELLLYTAFMTGISAERKDVYADVEEMEAVVSEVASGFTQLAEGACRASTVNEDVFKLEWKQGASEEVKKIIETSLKNVGLYNDLPRLTRDMLLYGDEFIEPVFTEDLLLNRLMTLPVDSMIRNELPTGELYGGTEQGTWAYEQYAYGGGQAGLLAGFYEWQICHLRWIRVGKEMYGRSLLYSARSDWRKLRAMEEALVINWLTRAFARLLFILDVQGKSKSEAEKYLQSFKASLSQQKVNTGKSRQEVLSVVKDIFLGTSYHEYGGKYYPALNDVKSLDTASSGFSSMDPVIYYRDKVIAAMMIPKAYLGIEEGVNAKATLSREDIRFAKTLRAIQAKMSELVVYLVQLQAAVQGIPKSELDFQLRWFTPAGLDELEASQALVNDSKADQVYAEMGVIDNQYIATRRLGMSEQEYLEVSARAKSDPDSAFNVAKKVNEAKARPQAGPVGGGKPSVTNPQVKAAGVHSGGAKP